MKIKREQIHPELRTAGTLLRLLLPRFTLRTFRLCNAVLDRFARGRPRTKRIAYRQAFVPRGDGSMLRLCIYSPKKPRAGVPGLLWLHGGGYAIGVPEQDAGFAGRFVNASGCAVVLPDYTRSMEAPYPAALTDCYLALLWLKAHTRALGINGDQLFVGGDSAGGGLAAALCLYARDRGEVSVAFQMPLYPMLDDRPTATSADNDAPVWNTPSNETAWRQYLGSLYGTDGVPAYAAPARAENVSGLPPALTYVGSIEPFYEETVRYVERLTAAGVPVSFRVFEGCFHAFDVMAGRSAPAQEARAFLLRGFLYAAEHFRKAQP